MPKPEAVNIFSIDADSSATQVGSAKNLLVIIYFNLII